MAHSPSVLLLFALCLCFCSTTVLALPIGIPPNVDIIRLNKTLMSRHSWDSIVGNKSQPISSDHCLLRPVEKGVNATVLNILDFCKLIEYTFTIKGYEINPLEVNNTWNYKPHKWARVASSHGQTILNLAFNYGILSLMTLSFGIAKMDIELEDLPNGCLGKLNENDKVLAVMDIVLRDLDPNKEIDVYEGQSSVCHQHIKKVSSMAKFTDRCCYKSVDKEGVDCITDIPNKWLSVLDILLGILTVMVFLFGPMMIPDWFYTAALDTLEYYVKLKEPLYKKLAVCRREVAQDIEADHVINLRNRRDFQKCRRILAELPDDMIIPIKISQFDIKVNYRKLLVENKVPVGMIDSISRAIFLCKIKELDAFKGCCDAKVMGCVKNESIQKINKPWIDICNIVGRFLLVFFVPVPFYIRLIVYYIWENPEINDRHDAASNLGLMTYYNFRLIQFLTPTHPIYIAIYVLYFLSGFTIAYFSGTDKKTQFQQGIMDAFQDMKDLSMLKAFEMLISNCLWPFKQYGIFGLFIGIILWPLLLPVSTVACSVYCIPLIFVSCRIFLHTFSGDVENRREKYKPSPQKLHADHVLQRLHSHKTRRAARDTCFYCSPNLKRFLLNLILSTITIATLYSAMLIVAEIITFVAEIMSFTMMGIIVNAATVLKYGTLLFLVVLYSIDCYSNVNKKYLKLNKAIFSEIKYRLGKDIEQYTQLPSHIQENRGFKSAEASDQAEYESIDDVCVDPNSSAIPFQWEINDLILFIDKEDTPRIPKKLFEDVCQINVAGAPGPVYKSLLYATRKFLVIIMFLAFVFIVVLSFGESYKVSPTNQMLATMAGGFMPFLFRNIFKPGKAEVETGLLSFKSKLEEIIKNFCQTWPMYEFVFEIEEEPKSDDDNKSEKDKDLNEKAESFECLCGGQHKKLCTGETANGTLENISKPEKIAYDSKQNKSKENESNAKDNSKQKSDKDNDKSGGGDKDKKDKKDGKNGIDWLKKIMRTKSVHLNVIKDKIDSLALEPAEGNKVDILIYVSDSDQEWNYDDSTSDLQFDDDIMIQFDDDPQNKSKYILMDNLENNHVMSI